MAFINQLHPYDICEVQCPNEWSSMSQKVLQLCYQPIIGIEATSLYLKLQAEASHANMSFHHHYLLDCLQLSINRLFEARITLEAIGLLQTFRKDHEGTVHYIYVLQQPLNAQRFFADPILSVSLMRKIDEKAFQHLRHMLTPPSTILKGYDNITRSFNDVFLNVTEKELQQVTKYSNDPEINEPYPFEYESFDFKLFFDGISQALIPHKLFTIDIKQTIAKVAFLYNFSAVHMQRIVMQSLTDDQQLTAMHIEKNAKDYFQLTKQQPYQLHTHFEQQEEKTTAKNDKDSHIHYLNTTSPIEVYTSLHGTQPTDVVVRLYSEYMERGIALGVINTLTEYIAMNEDRLNYNMNLMNSIIDTWVRSGASCAKSAMQVAKREHAKRQGKVVPTVEKSQVDARHIADEVKDYELSTPYEFLKLLMKGKEPFKTQLKTAESLMTVYKMAQGVTNVIVEYVWQQTNGKLPEKFVESVAAEMQQQHITEAFAAKQFLLARQQARFSITESMLGQFAKSPQALIYDQTTPYAFLKQLYNGKEPVRFLVELAERLVLVHKLPVGVVNYLMEYAMQETGGKMTQNFIQAVASNWMSQSFKSAQDAIDFVTQTKLAVTTEQKSISQPFMTIAQVREHYPQQYKFGLVDEKYEKLTPYEFIKQLFNNQEPPAAIVYAVEKLIKEQKMVPAVVSFLLEYVKEKTDGALPEKYVEKVADSWRMQQINTIEEAKKYIHRGKSTKGSKVEIVPEWFHQEKQQQEQQKPLNLDAEYSKLLQQLRNFDGKGEQ